jgi:hypothetical protein
MSNFYLNSTGGGGGSVDSVTGTANQVLATPTTGNVVVSLIGPYTPATYTAHGVLVGEGTSSIAAVPPDATSGIPLISQGSATDPAYGTAVVAGGGTGNTTFTAYSVIAAGTTPTGAFQNVSGVGTSGQVLTSNGAGALPTWQTGSGGSGIITIDGDSGSITGTTVSITAGNSSNTAGGAIKFVNSGTSSVLHVTDASFNTFFGLSCGNNSLTGAFNHGFGQNCLTNLVNGAENVGFGYGALNAVVGTSNNAAFGHLALNALTGGGGNTAIGSGGPLSLLTTGGNNIAIGEGAGENYTSSESFNILIGNQGIVGESHVVRIGIQGSGGSEQNLCYIAGITGASPVSGNTPQVTLCDNVGNLTTISSSTSGFVLTSQGTGTPAFLALPTALLSITTVNHAASPYTVLAADQFLAVNVSGGVVTLNLPNTTTTGRVITVKDSTGGATTSHISVTTVGGTVTIDGQTTYTLDSNYAAIRLVFDGTNYEVF